MPFVTSPDNEKWKKPLLRNYLSFLLLLTLPSDRDKKWDGHDGREGRSQYQTRPVATGLVLTQSQLFLPLWLEPESTCSHCIHSHTFTALPRQWCHRYAARLMRAESTLTVLGPCDRLFPAVPISLSILWLFHPLSPATDLPWSKAFCSAAQFILHILFWYRRHFTSQDKKDHIVDFFVP